MKPPDSSNPVGRRQVARRACLSCREKKIKCDGESVNRNSEGDDDKSGGIKICSNCKMLGADCVFVQSMRGGRRKKRSASKLEEDESAAKAANTETETVYNGESPGNRRGDGLRLGSVSSFTTEEYKRSSYSPSLSYSAAAFPDSTANFRRERLLKPGDQGRSEYMQDYPDHFDDYDPHFSPHMHHKKHGHGPMYPPPFLPSFYHHGPPDDHHGPPGDHHHGPPGDHHRGPPGDHPPGPKPPFHHHHHWPPPHHRKPPHLRKFFDNYPPPWYNQYPPPFPMHSPIFGYPLPPPPPPHHHNPHTSPGPMYPSKGSSNSSSREPTTLSETSGSRPHMRFPYSEQDSRSNSIDTTSMKSYSGCENPYYYRRDMDTRSESKYGASVSSNNSVISDEYYPPYGSKEQESPESTYYEERRYHQRTQFFSDAELANYDLPNWETLNKVLDYYYTYRSTNHMLLVSKSNFLKNIALSRDSSVIHALIATVCSIFPPNIPLQKDEHHWICNTFRFWDNLDDFGMLLSYTLISKTSTFHFGAEKIMEMNKKKWDIINSNKYLDILTIKSSTSLNSRQKYEKEMITRMIWNYWIMRTLLFRYTQRNTVAPPYAESINSNNDISGYIQKIPFPLTNESYLLSEHKRRNLEDLAGLDLKKEELSGAESLIYAFRVFEQIVNKIYRNELDELVPLNESFAKSMESKFMSTVEKRNLISINATYLTAGQVLYFSDCLQQLKFLEPILVFNEQQRDSRTMFTSRVSLISFMNDISMTDLLSFETLPNAINSLSDFQWNCMINLIYSIRKMIGLLEFENVNPNSRFYMENSSYSEEEINTLNGLIGNLRETWLKYNEFSIVCYSNLLPVLSSLVILTKFIKITKEDGNLKIEVSNSDTVKYLSCPEEVMQSVIESFELDALYKRLTLVVDFMKTMLKGYHDSIGGETVIKMKKIVLYLEEILNGIK